MDRTPPRKLRLIDHDGLVRAEEGLLTFIKLSTLQAADRNNKRT